MHPDFDELRESDDFHNWAKNNPSGYRMPCTKIKTILDQLYVLLILFKVDNGMDIKSRKRTTKDAASQVKTKRNTRIDDAGVAGQILESQVQKMTAQTI